MTKQADPKTFLRAVIGGFRYSRAPPDTTPPTTPVLSPPVPSSTSIAIQWTNGIDAQTGIASTYAEISPNGANTWTRTVVAYPGTSTTFTGLASMLPFDIRLANVDNAGNVSAYCAIQTVTTLPSSSDLEPGTIALGLSQIVTNEQTLFGVPVTRTGAGPSAPDVQADWAFSGFNQGTPSPANGTVSWTGNDQTTQLIQAASGDITANQTGKVSIVALRALTGNISPTLGSPSQASVSLIATSAFGTKWHPGHYVENRTKVTKSTTIAGSWWTQTLPTAVKGFLQGYGWGVIEDVTPGAYTWTKIDNDLAQIKAVGKRMIIRLYTRSCCTAGTSPVPYLPTYIINGGSYGTVPSSYGTQAKMWEAATATQYIAMLQAVAARYDSDPAVEAVIGDETALGLTGSSTFTQGAWLTQLERIQAAWRAVAQRTQFYIFGNYLSPAATNLTALYANSLATQTGNGGPDLAPPRSVDGYSVSTGAIGTVDYRGQIPLLYCYEYLPYLNGQSAQQCYDFAMNTLKANYICWTQHTDGTAAQNWTTGVVPVINANPNTITTCPSGNPGGCATGN